MTKVVLLGLDGATFEMLNPMLDTGRLPVLSHLLRGGAHGVLESTIPPVTFPAWPTMYTGRNPGAHGLTSFRRFDAATLGFLTAGSPVLVRLAVAALAGVAAYVATVHLTDRSALRLIWGLIGIRSGDASAPEA